MMRAERLTSDSMILGESPIWDHRVGLLRWVDISGRAVHSLSTGGHRTRTVLSDSPGCIGLAGAEDLVGGVGRHVIRMSPTGKVRRLAKPALRRTRMNDGAVDEAGRFWVGTCPNTRLPATGTLFRCAVDGRVATVLDGVSLSNGIGWSPDGRRMYYIDTPTQRVDVMDFSPNEGTIADRRAFVEVPEATGNPDGLTVDSLGNVWVALWGGGAVHIYSPDGQLIDRVQVEADNVTSLCFGGLDLRTVFITTARRDPEAPDSGGAIYVLSSLVAGSRSHVFGIPTGPGSI